MESKTHWKKLINPDYLGAYSLNPNEERTLTIKKVTRDKVTGPGGKKTECTVLHFKENEKPMILNRTNAKTITSIYGTPYIEEWIGKGIIVFADKVEAFGEEVEALRIKATTPELPELTKDMKAYGNAVIHVQGGGSVEDIEKRFRVGEEMQKSIMADAKNPHYGTK